MGRGRALVLEKSINTRARLNPAAPGLASTARCEDGPVADSTPAPTRPTVPISPGILSPDRLREVLGTPVSRVPELAAIMVTSYDLVVKVLRDDATFVPAIDTLAQRELRRLAREEPQILVEYRDSRAQQGSYRPTLIQAGGPDHLAQRQLVANWFSPSRLDQLRTELLSIARSTWVDAQRRAQPVDVREPAQRLAQQALALVLGIPAGEAEQIGQWSHDILRLRYTGIDSDDLRRGIRASKAMNSYFRDLVAEPQTGGAGASLLVELCNSAELAEGQAIDLLQQLAVAGSESTAATLPSIVALALATTGWQQWTQVADPLSKFVREALRLRHSSRTIARVAKQETQIGDVKVRRGELVWLHLEQANVDPTYFSAEVDTLAPASRPHLAFGMGRHRCIGAALATIELECALAALGEVCPMAQIVGISWPQVYDLGLRRAEEVLVDLGTAPSPAS